MPASIRALVACLLILAAATAIAAADAAPPAGERLTWGEEPVEGEGPQRARICLNGLWRFMPATGVAENAPIDKGWGLMRVPGSWLDNEWLAARGTGQEWEAFDPKAVHKAWYERPLTIPAAWTGRAVVLELDRVSTDAVVFLDGVECGRVGWSAGEVELTKAAKPGTAQTLRILVAAIADEGEAISFMGIGAGQLTTVKKEIESKGLIGEVFVHARPLGAHVSDVFVQTSLSRHELAATVELSGLDKATAVEFSARVLGPDGTEAATFPVRRLDVAAGAPASVRVAWPWATPILWDLDHPNLCRLQLSVKASRLADTYEQEFGFREFAIDGRRFLLNGSEVRLRPQTSQEQWCDVFGNLQVIDGWIAGARQAGFNFLEFWPFHSEDRGGINFRRIWFERCDRSGMLTTANAGSLGAYAVDTKSWQCKWDRPDGRAAWLPEATREVRRYRNHPSVVMWALAANFMTGHNQDQNPLYLGKRDWIPTGVDKKPDQYMALVADAQVVVKALDPTRPSYTHQGGYAGDVFTLNHYLCMTPMQEREEWLSEWALHGTMPYIGVEFGAPLECTFNRGRADFGQASTSEPLATEFAAIYAGAEAYRSETPAYRAEIKARFTGGDLYKSWQGNARLEELPAIQSLLALFNRNTWRSWRTMGVTGGMIPWSDAQGWIMRKPEEVVAAPFVPGQRGSWWPKIFSGELYRYQAKGGFEVMPSGRELMAANQPTLAWIAGAAVDGDVAAFTAKDHSYRAGEDLRKQAVLINDTRDEQSWTMTWRLELGGTEITKGEQHGRIANATTLFLPIVATLPATLASAKVDGRLSLDAQIGEVRHHDAFTIRVFAPVAPVSASVLLHDPDGATTKLLAALGVTAQPWNGKPADALLVIGRRAMSSPLPGDLLAYARAGGRILIMAQPPELLREQLGARVARHLSRRVFPVDVHHPVLAGLDAEDLRDWRGDSTLVPARPDLPAAEFNMEQRFGWHWGNRGAVTSAAIEKPHSAGWRPILECEFDLAYSPLMDLTQGTGRMVWCQLDLEDHAAADPAADRLARQLLTWAAALKPAAKPMRTILVANDVEAQLVGRSGLRAERIATVPAAAVLAVVGAGVDDAQIQACLDAGGTVVSLPRRSARGPLGVTLAERASVGSVEVPAWPEAAGLSASDLRWRAEATAWLIAGGCDTAADGQLGRKMVGTGKLIVCQLDPERFAADKTTYFRITRWRQTRALAQVLANCGAELAGDERLVHPRSRDELSVAGDWKAHVTLKLPAAPSPDKGPEDSGPTAAATAAVAVGFDDAAWETVQEPAMYGPFTDADGEAVFRRQVMVPAAWAGKDLALELGGMDDFDNTFWNGEVVGSTDKTVPNFWSAKRHYVVPGRLVKAGANVLAIRLFDHFGGGGFSSRPDEFLIKPRGEEETHLYSPDWREEFDLGDDPYRYKRW